MHKLGFRAGVLRENTNVTQIVQRIGCDTEDIRQMFAGAKFGNRPRRQRRRAKPDMIDLKEGIFLGDRALKHLEIRHDHRRVEHYLAFLLRKIEVGPTGGSLGQ
jgi:hypothetical protein